MKLPVSEIFTSIQGEGLRVGIPSVFVRILGCDLRCWWCDTAYSSWNPEKGKTMTIPQIIHEIEKTLLSEVVITGGEPTLFPTQLRELARTLDKKGCFISIETAGHHYIPDLPLHLVTISYKLPSSHQLPLNTPPPPKWKQKPLPDDYLQSLKLWTDNYYTQIKFTALGYASYTEISQALDSLRMAHIPVDQLIKEHRVFIMPEGTTHEQLKQYSEEVALMCIQMGLRMSDRLHIRIWDNKRGH